MKVIKKRLDDLKHPEKNVRIHSEQQIRELKRSLEKFGQTRALVVDENNVILIGNGLYEAMVSLGYQEASVYVKTELSENDNVFRSGSGSPESVVLQSPQPQPFP